MLCFYFIFLFPLLGPSVGPDRVSLAELNGTTFNISWAPLIREKSYGKVILYDVKEELLLSEMRQKRSPISSRTLNTTATFVVLYDLPPCSQYLVSVRAYTNAGPGPYSQPMVLETSSEYDIRASSVPMLTKRNILLGSPWIVWSRPVCENELSFTSITHNPT